ncbi:hypothetical protein PFISCL1PPCAC_3450, partial [Pristionchus fissidentatus]
REMGDPSNRRCLICAVPVSSPYYGVDACRACALFFKRAKLSGKKFVCRQGGRQCMLVKGTRPICRSCRYESCIISGMKYEKKAKVDNALHDIPNDWMEFETSTDANECKVEINGIDQAKW